MEVISSRFLEEATTSLGVVTDGHYSVAPLAAWKHPLRDRVYEELEWSFLEAPEKYEPHRKAMETQVAGYERDGFPAHAGLYGANTLVWNLEHPCVCELGKAWLEERAGRRFRISSRSPSSCGGSASRSRRSRTIRLRRAGSMNGSRRGDSSGDPPRPRGHREPMGPDTRTHSEGLTGVDAFL